MVIHSFAELEQGMKMGRKERARTLRTMNLLKLSMMELGAQCQALGLSGRGTREELTERLHRHIWLHCFDCQGE